MADEGIPEGASNIGNGVFTKRGGYRDVGNRGIELPTVSGTEIALTQDGETSDIKVQSNYFDSEGNLVAPPAEAAPAAASTPPSGSPATEQVESIGQAVGDGYLAPGVSSAKLPTPPPFGTSSTRDATQAPTVAVSLKHESGFQMTIQWDTVIVTEPLNGVATLVLALDPKGGIILPAGRYELTVAESDTYAVMFGNQTFEHGLRYYVFVVEG